MLKKLPGRIVKKLISKKGIDIIRIMYYNDYSKKKKGNKNMDRLTVIIERGAEYRRSPALVRDTHCGEEFYLQDEYLGACECPRCGQWFNLFGQEVTDPSSWSSGSDW